MASAETGIGPDGLNFAVYKGSPNRCIVQGTTHRERLNDDEVLLRVTHSGLCGTNEHFLDRDMCLGHEGAGIVEALGPSVKNLKVPSRSATSVPPVVTARSILTVWRYSAQTGPFMASANFDIGSMAFHIVFRETFIYTLPPKLSLAAAASLMCGGATVFNVFDMFDVWPTQRVGIVGLGGLGRLAVQFAAKVGCEVVVFSSTEAKRDEALGYDAHEFVATKGVDSLEGRVRPVHHLIVCANFQVPWDLYLPIVHKPGSVYPLTVAWDELKLPYVPWLFGALRIQASVVAPRAAYRRMLDFVILHGIEATIEKYSLSQQGIERAMRDLRDGKTRYKAVLYGDGEN